MKKGMNRLFVFSLVGLFLISLMASFVVADNHDIAERAAAGASGAVTGAGEFLSSTLAPLFGDKEMLTRFFFAILLFMIIQPIVKGMFKWKGQKAYYSWIFGGIVTLLALFGLPSNFLEAIRVNYGAMGAAILAVIPFIILLIFTVKTQSKLIARLIWFFFVGYYFMLYLDKIFNASAGWWSAETIPYLGAIIIGAVIFLFIGTFRNLMFKGELDSEEEQAIRDINRRGLGRKLERKETDSRLNTSS